jgi:RNA polymerase primary sigma factor
MSEPVMPGDADRGPDRSRDEPDRLGDSRSALAFSLESSDEHDYVHETLCFVPSIARRYLGRGATLDELVAAGNLGLVEAALRFDPGRGVRFTTYANWWIRKAIIDSLGHQAGPMRLPRYQYDKLKCLRDARSRWMTSHGAEPSVEELAGAAGLTTDEVHRLRGLATGTVSLEQPLSPGDTRPAKDVLADPASESPDRVYQRRDLTERLRQRIGELVLRDRQVLALRFGLDGGVALTLRETGRRLGISRERVRQVELRALARLRETI